MKASIFEIKRFAVHDGDGIRTTVFLKGCPLSCVWCHNPEGIDFKPQLAWYADKCISCGECGTVCPEKAHDFSGGVHRFDREKCIACGKCEAACFYGALKFYGREMSIPELLPMLLEDRDFYDSTGGGVTLSGGECLMQADFCAELLRALKGHGIHTAVDTCGFVSKEAIDKVLPYTDVFLYDLKAMDEQVHIHCTGHANGRILENLRYIHGCGGKIEVRIPYVPGYNDDQVEKIAAFLGKLDHACKVRVLPYHNYAGSKYESLGMKCTLPERLPNDAEIDMVRRILQSHVCVE